MRAGKATRWLLGAGLLIVGAVTAWSCGVDPESLPKWEIAKARFDFDGNGAMLTPGNDTRVNLLLLLADARRLPVRDPEAPEGKVPLALFRWLDMAADAEPPASRAWDYRASRCQTLATGAAAFEAAIRANRAVPDAERQALLAARADFSPECSESNTPPPVPAVASFAGKAFAAYLTGAGQFYAGAFDQARATFAALGGAPDPWVRETALYMVARTALNRAQEHAFDEFGYLADPKVRDRAAIASAGAALNGYLRIYPNGRYAASARGLTRRVAWLAGDAKALAAAFERQIEGNGAFDGAAGAASLVGEIDSSLLEPGGGGEVRDPLLLAVVDLQRMRCVEDLDTPAEDCVARPADDVLERQAPLFAGQPALFGYLRAAQAYFVDNRPREVLALIPDAARQRVFSYIEFSRQMLRGEALEAVADRNARNFWLSLFQGAVQPYQREALELALALHDERSGDVARVFAADSKVRHPVMRQLLLEHVAGPDLLRKQTRDPAALRQERDVAIYVLLAKELRHGFYAGFLNDIAQLPADAAAKRYENEFWGAREYEPGDDELWPPPLTRFSNKAKLGDAGCPPLADTVRRLESAAGAVRPRLCLAEYFRANGFDDFERKEPASGRGLGTSKTQFPGAPYQRLEVYKAVIADPSASDDDRAFALNRAVRCYGPSGFDSCGGADVPVEVRRAWFNRLKRDYPKSRWAQSLKFYW
ncbi:MAG: hypothetical protein QOJ94_88 [Sphingomonadales bacterium]|nr:hypothetical protein [Sphingomonadales bacterium]